jgi:hypothetical protein
VTEQIKKKPHGTFLKKISNSVNNLTEDSLNSLQEIENNKYLLMPSVYGMGKFSYRTKLADMIDSPEDERFLI